MSNAPRIFEPAETQYNDWLGTVALDGDESDLYGSFKLDREKWAILGVSIFGSIRQDDLGKRVRA